MNVADRSSKRGNEEDPQIILKAKKDNDVLDYKIVKEPKFCVIRTNFDVHQNEYTDWEKKKLDYFLQLYQSNKSIEKRLRESDMNTFFNKKLIGNISECCRFLNMFSYDIDSALINMINYIEILRKLNDQNNFLNLYNNYKEVNENSDFKDYKDLCLNNIDNIFSQLGKDSQDYAILGLDFSNDKIKKIYVNNPIEEIVIPTIFFLNGIFETKHKQDKIFQQSQNFSIVINLEKVSESYLSQNVKDLIKLFQYMYPSRLNQIFMYSDVSDLLLHIEENIFDYNLEKIVIINSKVPSEVLNHHKFLNTKIIKDFFTKPEKIKIFNSHDDENLPSFTEFNNHNTEMGLKLKNELEVDDFFYVGEINEILKKQLTLEKNDIDNTSLYNRQYINTFRENEIQSVLNSKNLQKKELQIENIEKFNFTNLSLNTMKSDFLTISKEFKIDHNSFSITSMSKNIIENKQILKKKKHKLDFESSGNFYNCDIKQCLIL